VLDRLAWLRPSVLGPEVSRRLVAAAGHVAPAHTVSRVAGLIRLPNLISQVAGTAETVGALLVVVATIEYLSGSRRSPYLSRVFAQDVAWAFFNGPIFGIFIWAAIAGALGRRLDVLQIDLLARLPAGAHLLIYWLLGDFIHYWLHRLEHSWAPLWAFHSVHHSQTEMTFVSTHRFHPVEQLVMNLSMVVPLLVIGIPPSSWIGVTITLWIFDAVQHSALDWTYGRGYALFVSPRFHALHHSIEPRHSNGNYSKILSAWDYLFGTAIRDERPERLGVAGIPPPRTFMAQMLAPFRLLAARAAGDRPSRQTAGVVGK